MKKHYDYEINLFVDGELEQDQRKELFVHLAECEECSKTLADLILLKEKSRSIIRQNITEIKNKPKKTNYLYRIGFYSSAAAAIVLLFLLATAKPKETFVTKNEVRVDTVLVEKQKSIVNAVNEGGDKSNKQKKYGSIQVAELNGFRKIKTTKITYDDLIKYESGS